jgi:hypothetical protein
VASYIYIYRQVAIKAFMHYVIYLRVTSGKTLCMRREERINLSMFCCISI